MAGIIHGEARNSIWKSYVLRNNAYPFNTGDISDGYRNGRSISPSNGFNWKVQPFRILRNIRNFFDITVKGYLGYGSMEENEGSEQPSAGGFKEVRRDSRDKLKALTIEFQYYRGLLDNLELAMTDSGECALASDWMKKLFGVEYHVEVLRDKRNRYLAALAINMINDQITGVFETPPPEGPLQEIHELSIITPGQAEWETDTTWSEFYSAIPEDMDEISCTFHPNNESCEEDIDMDKQLENEFWFLLYHIRPCVAIMPCPASKSKVIHWIYTLCRLSAIKCHKMKNLRNEYAYSLYSYVIDLKAAGPFEDNPPRRKLPPIAELAKKIAERYPITSPYNSDANSFMESQPAPEEGAICYVAVTGDMFDPNRLLPR